MLDLRALPIEWILLTGALLLVFSILASKISQRFGVPVLLIFLGVGMLAGSDGLGGIYFDDPWVAQLLGTFALVYILFAGGLDTDMARARPVLGHSLVLATLGVVITALLVGVFAMWALKLTFTEGLLFGAIVSSTDAAAVFSILRSRAMRLSDPLEPLLEMESGSNDPMAVFLTVMLTSLLKDGQASFVALLGSFFLQMLLGAVVGYLGGRLVGLLMNRIRLQAEGLYSVLMAGSALSIYAISAVLGGNGFLSVYLAGLVLSSSRFIHKRSLLRFHDGLSWLMQILMFLTLGLLVFPSRLGDVLLPGILMVAFLMLVARPVSVFISLAFSRFNFRQKLLVSWVGLRGAVPIILATYPLVAGLPRAEMFFNIVFFVVLASVLIQGTTLGVSARLLKLIEPPDVRPQYPLEFEQNAKYHGEMIEYLVAPGSRGDGKMIMELGLPDGALVVLVHRGDEFMVPRGSLTLQAGDRMQILCDQPSKGVVREIMDSSIQ